MNRITLTGKITSDLQIEQTRSKEGVMVDMYRLKIISQAQGDPKEEAHIEFRSYDPKITRVMAAAKAGDPYIVTGTLITKIERYERKDGSIGRRPKYWYIHADGVEKIIE